MRFNGKDLLAVHPAISIEREILPGMAARDIATAEEAGGETVVNVTTVRGELTVRVNIAARSYDEAAEVRALLAQWATSSGDQPAELEPTRTPGKGYLAIVSRIGAMEKRFTTVDVVFLLPRPVLHDIAPQIRRASGTAISVQVGGSAPAQPVIAFAPDAAAENVTLSMDGTPFFTLDGTLEAGQELAVMLETGAVTVDGVHAESRIVYTESNLDAEMSPGKHTLTASAAGTLTVRWKNQWQ